MHPKDPRPPKFETAAVSLCEESPPKGPCTIGYSMPTRFEKRSLIPDVPLITSPASDFENGPRSPHHFPK